LGVAPFHHPTDRRGGLATPARRCSSSGRSHIRKPALRRKKEGTMNTRHTNAGRDLEALRAAIAGQVSVPGQAGYDQARQAWNLAVDERPSVVVVAESASDVIEAVRYARRLEMRIAPQGTGHGAAPLEPLDDAMLLRTTGMRQIDVDPATRTARAEAGAVWQDVIDPAGEHGLAGLAGSSPNVRVSGHTPGGRVGL